MYILTWKVVFPKEFLGPYHRLNLKAGSNQNHVTRWLSESIAILVF